jgi:DUF4097 and DUF4098 domain-containing protein YvlB
MPAHLRDARRPARLAAAVLMTPLAALMAGCMAVHDLAGRATDEWTRTYALTPGGQIEIVNTNGKVQIEGADVESVEIRAERIARATTDAAARDLLPRIEIKEEIAPDRIRIETGRIEGITIGIRTEVRYTVRAPRTAVVRVTNTNGEVSATGLTAQLFARTTNGPVKATDVAGEVTARTTNGEVEVELAELTAKVSLQTTNGGVELTVPDDAKADLSASCTNGGINVSGLKLETTESSRRRVEGKLNGGGALIDVRTTNGGIRVRSRSSATQAQRHQGNRRGATVSG